MSSKNIFNTTAGIDHRIHATSMFKDRSSPYKRPPREEKKEQKKENNALVDFEVPENYIKTVKNSLFEKLVDFALALLGKKKQWQAMKVKLQTLQNRINTFEQIINDSKAHTSVKMKDYSV